MGSALPPEAARTARSKTGKEGTEAHRAVVWDADDYSSGKERGKIERGDAEGVKDACLPDYCAGCGKGCLGTELL